MPPEPVALNCSPLFSNLFHRLEAGGVNVMKRRVRISLIGMLASLFFCAGVAMTEDTPANTTTPALWTHDFKEKLIKVEALPGTYLGVVSGPLKHKKKEPYKATRWLLAGQAGGGLWPG